jgi:hypothetical protein
MLSLHTNIEKPVFIRTYRSSQGDDMKKYKKKNTRQSSPIALLNINHDHQRPIGHLT